MSETWAAKQDGWASMGKVGLFNAGQALAIWTEDPSSQEGDREGKARRRFLLHVNLPVGVVEWLRDSPGRGEGLPIFLPFNGESWRCFHCAGQSDSLPDAGLHY